MRVIAGAYKGLPLQTIPSNATRPTSDKVKESLFQMLGPFFPEGRILDLYGGSGAIAIEAVSRGMDFGVIVETHPKAQEIIKENIMKTKQPEKFSLLSMSARNALNQPLEPFDLVFLDPPYADQTLEEDLKILAQNKLVNPGRIVVCETDAEVFLPEKVLTFELITEKNYGKTKLYFYRNED